MSLALDSFEEHRGGSISQRIQEKKRGLKQNLNKESG